MKFIKHITAEETYSIRLEVLRKGVDLPYKFDGDSDKNTFHLGAFKQEKLVGVATFMKRKSTLIQNDTQYQLRGMATLTEVRGLGFGNLLLAEADSILKEKKIAILWCNAREIALKFYQKNGFEIIGKPFDIPQIGKHFVMYKRL